MVYSLVAATVLLALLSLYFLAQSLNGGTGQRIIRLLFAISFAYFVYLYGCWVFLSVYLKYAFAAASLIALMVAIFKRRKIPGRRKSVYAPLFFAALFTSLNIMYFTGTTGIPETVDLSFPLKGGNYLVFQGGKGLPTNLFHYSYRGAIYAMDLIKLDDMGRRGTHIFSANLNDYYTFGDTVYSPCNGRIIKTQSSNPDNIPPSRERGPTNTNQVLIDAGHYFVFLGHLKQYSVLVHEGDSVVAGQALAQVGNSGFSLEPHLHIQVHAKEEGKPWYKGRPLYIQFNGRSYLLFQQVATKHLDR